MRIYFEASMNISGLSLENIDIDDDEKLIAELNKIFKEAIIALEARRNLFHGVGRLTSFKKTARAWNSCRNLEISQITGAENN